MDFELGGGSDRPVGLFGTGIYGPASLPWGDPEKNEGCKDKYHLVNKDLQVIAKAHQVDLSEQHNPFRFCFWTFQS